MQQHLHRWFFYKQETACQKPEKLKKSYNSFLDFFGSFALQQNSLALLICLPYIGSSNEEQEAAMIETLKAEEY